ncbi:tRNA/rRNA methyltransferase SpoU [Fimbriimonas ginsengisoli Gsoil 348]|uniref:tRNA/rRNA methyltransferase SpoU n=2 Tax=Fimbriimonas ginsengisoli TaxID=1005039 RepID=A0A068NMJ7_FIMGI|nr:RNA methyltransferase [Fimbriimonas ginsengisoli]AIE84681.1 tRNA/rRNA methyltransferase SpoU [Fimbriimonas ginsengisoli Gsoil 348]
MAEGARFLAAAWREAASFAGLVVCPALLHGEDAWGMVDRLRKAQVPTLRVDPRTYASVSLCHSSPDDPVERLPAAARQGILAIFRQRWEPLPDRLRRNDLWIGVESVRTPGNFGTMLRGGDAVGASGVIVFDRSEAGTPTGPDPYDPAVVRATMGSLFAHRLIRTTHRDFRRWAGRSEISAIGATPEAATDYRSITYRRPVLLMMGDERAGLSDGQRGSCDRLVRIPMVGSPDSLNLAMAGTLMLYEAYNQRHPVARRER